MFGVRPEKKAAFYTAIGKAPDVIFPIMFEADPGLATGAVSGSVNGFYKRARNGIIDVER